MHFDEWKFCISIPISLKFVPNSPIGIESVLVQANGDPVHQCIYVALGGDELT